MELYIIVGVITGAVFLFILAGIAIVPQSKSYVLERLGQFKSVWESGIHWRIPILDRVSIKVTNKEKVLDFDPQDVITKDNVTMMLDAVVFYRITDAKLYAYGAENPTLALYNLAATTVRNIIGELSLDETLTSRDTMNVKLRTILDEATDPWGIKVSRVEVKNITPPESVRNAMEQQMRAEREKRSAIITAEGEKKARITESEGYKESMILRAEGDARSTELKYEALSKAIGIINKSKPDNAALQLEALKTLEKVSEGKATKLVIPTELMNIASIGQLFDFSKDSKQSKSDTEKKK